MGGGSGEFLHGGFDFGGGGLPTVSVVGGLVEMQRGSDAQADFAGAGQGGVGREGPPGAVDVAGMGVE